MYFLYTYYIYLSPPFYYLLPANCIHLHDQHLYLYLSVLKNTSKEGLELLRLLINSGALLLKKVHVAGSRSTLCNKDMGPITLQPLYDVIVALVMDYSLMYGWTMIVKGLT